MTCTAGVRNCWSLRRPVLPVRHVYCVRLDEQEMSKLQALARRLGVTVSVVLRELVRAVRVVRSGDSARE